VTQSAAPQFAVLISEPRDDYTLIDSGNGRKYERYGDKYFIRPEPQAMWAPAADDWDADAEFIPGSDDEGGGRWYNNRPVPIDGWPLIWNDEVTFNAQCTPFRHLGFFPDMDPVWRWMRGQIADKSAPDCMNLFGYTGVGTLALSAVGANMVHVDASKKSVAQARVNAQMSDMADRPVRWIVDDAAKFVVREVRRARRYDGILLDPPKYGRGPDGEVWRLEEDLAPLIANCRLLLDADSRFLFLTVYAVRMSALALGALMESHMRDLPGDVEFGELAVREERRGLLLPTAIFARWSQKPIAPKTGNL
jgi:23S rRNA (cytosine1962-C5)-methyltransferase